ncbi:MAG TPA: hypothetical protein VF432_31150 [Thermoanaerobaculia bacterium]
MTTLDIAHRDIERQDIERRSTEALAGGRVNSAIAAAHLQWVRDYHGDDAVKDLFWKLDREVAEELGADGGWLSFATLIALDRAIERRFGRGRRGFMRELGRYSAHLNLTGSHVRGAAVHDFLHRSAVLHARFQNFGSVKYEELDLTSGRMTHTAECFSPAWCASAIGYYEQALVMQEAIPLRVDEVSCRCNGAARCTFELQWS